MIPFNFHHLYYFFTVAEIGSVSKAAQKLHVSQPALSAQIRQLERYLKVKLFERDGKRLVLTNQGKAALEYAKVIFDTGKEFIDNFQDRAQKGKLRIQVGVSNSIAKIFIVQLIGFIIKLNPSAHIVINKDTPKRLIEGIDNHELDLVFTDSPLINIEGDLACHLLAKVPIVFCGHEKLLSRHNSLIKALKSSPIILPTPHSQLFNQIQEYFILHGIVPKVIAQVQDVELMHRLVIDGQGIAPLNHMSVIQSAFKEKLIIPAQKPMHDLHDTLYFLTKKRHNVHPLVDTVFKEFKLVHKSK